MNKQNIFCTSPFHMNAGDILTILIIDETGIPMEIELSGDNDNYPPSAPLALPATSITETGFTANWYFNENSTGYYLDVATDIGFTSFVAGYNNKDAGNVVTSTLTGLAVATNYYYRLRAYNDYGTSPDSNTITVVTTNVFGTLYNWYAMTSAKGIASAGWHVPNNVEWETLRSFLGGQLVAGGSLKETGLNYWLTPNTGATNISGFNARGTGFRSISGTYSGFKISYLVHSNETYGGAFQNVGPTLANSNAQMSHLQVHPGDKALGLSVRLLKDSTILSDGQTGTYTGNDGKIYNTICMGTQEWISANLAETKYADGDPIPAITDNTLWAADVTGARCWYNNIAP